MQADAQVLELFKSGERISCIADSAIKLGGDDDITLLDRFEEALTLRAIGKRAAAAKAIAPGSSTAAKYSTA